MQKIFTFFMIIFVLAGCSNTIRGVQKDSKAVWKSTKKGSTKAWEATKEATSDAYSSTKKAIHDATAEENEEKK